MGLLIRKFKNGDECKIIRENSIYKGRKVIFQDYFINYDGNEKVHVALRGENNPSKRNQSLFESDIEKI